MSVRKGSNIIAAYGSGSGGHADYINNQNLASEITRFYDWIGTLEEYENQNVALTHPEWVCFITDDNEGGDSVYTKTEMDTLLNNKLSDDIITNCITYIPQDILYEWDQNTGKITLKAGSKIYIPNDFDTNNERVFNEVTINSDQPLTNSFSGQYNAIFICWDSANNVLRQTPTVNSGASDPSTANNRIWYDTTANKIKYYENAGTSVTSDSLSLPICIMQNAGSGGGFTKIQQVFNGFGVIGTHTFVLPGVTAAFANGFNEDGTYKNTIVKNQKVNIRDLSLENSRYANIFNLDDNNLALGGWGIANYYEGEEYPSSMIKQGYQEWWYNTLQNKVYTTQKSTPDVWEFARMINIGTLTKVANANITEFKVKKTLKILDYNNTEYIGHQSMPSNKYIDLTLGASGTSYIAPADGYVWASGVSSMTENNAWLDVYDNKSVYSQSITHSNNNQLDAYIPVSKGTTFFVGFSNLTLNRVRFTYAQGSK